MTRTAFPRFLASVSIYFLTSALWILPAFADWVVLKDGKRLRGLDYKKESKGYLFTLEDAKRLYEHTVELFREAGLTVATGKFQEHMLVTLQNDGPVTLMLDSADRQRPRRPSTGSG